MNDYLLTLIQKYKSKGILVDTNILLLYIIGSLNISLIRNFSRTAGFTEEDFNRVSKFVDFFETKITTPHILTEVSNLFGNKSYLNGSLKGFLKLADERILESVEIVENEAFLEFGLTDAAVIETSKDSYLVFTDDRRLFGYLVNKGIGAVNLDQVRMI